jgi:NTE family protein
MPIRFATVATEFGTGHEIWLTRGRLSDALRASYALPGVFDPVLLDGRWLMDGALVNPVPVTLARAFGSDLIVCINLNTEIRLRGTVIQSQPDAPAPESPPSPEQAAETRSWRRFVLNQDGMPNRRTRRPQSAPSMAAALVDAFNITQDRISRSRLAGDPPDLTIAPRLSDIGLFEFHRAAECIELGRQAAERAIPEIREALSLAGDRRAAGAQAVAM